MAAKKAAAGDAFAAAYPEAFKEGYEKFARSMTDAADFQKETLEAMMASAGVLAKAAEKAAAEQTAFAKDAFEEGMAAMRAASTSKSVQDALEIQAEYARSAIEKSMGHVSKLAEHWTGVMKDAADPVTKRYAAFIAQAQAYRP